MSSYRPTAALVTHRDNPSVVTQTSKMALGMAALDEMLQEDEN